METVEIIDAQSDTRWPAFVDQHPLGTLAHTPAWQSIIENSFAHIKGSVIALVDDRAIRAAMPVYSVRSWITGNRLVSIPFATLCDPLVSSPEEFVRLVESAKEFANERHLPRLEIRTFATVPMLRDAGMTLDSSFKLHKMKLLPDAELLKKTFDRSCVVQKISRSLKSNLTVRRADNPGDVSEFYRLYSMTRKRVGLPPQPFMFFNMLWSILAPLDQIEILLAYKDATAIASLLLLKHKKNMSAEYMGYDHHFLQLNPHHLLFWNAIQSGCSRGYEVFDFGRTAASNTGLMEFKKHWGTTISDLGQYEYPGSNTRQTIPETGTFKRRMFGYLCKNAPEFVFQKISDLIYHHMG